VLLHVDEISASIEGARQEQQCQQHPFPLMNDRNAVCILYNLSAAVYIEELLG
jgi:hypothetical protein